LGSGGTFTEEPLSWGLGRYTFYIHALLFALWMLVIEKSPYPTLTLAVSLEAIFLSTFVMIGQNRQAAFQQAKADTDYKDVNTLLEENTRLTRAIHQLTRDVHERLIEDAAPPAGEHRNL
jgi:uncharacterized membrane protein